MELQYFGANCLRITTKNAAVVVDDNLKELKLKSITRKGDISVFTGAHGEPESETKLVIDYPGEYEVSNVSIQGISARAHTDESGKKSAIIYRLIADESRVALIGHIYPELSDEQLEILGAVDVLCIPVGGNGYTLDPVGALKLIKAIEPKIVIPTHYADKAIAYPVPQQDLDTALRALSMEPKEKADKLKIRPAEFTDTTQLIVLNRQG